MNTQIKNIKMTVRGETLNCEIRRTKYVNSFTGEVHFGTNWFLDHSPALKSAQAVRRRIQFFIKKVPQHVWNAWNIA